MLTLRIRGLAAAALVALAAACAPSPEQDEAAWLADLRQWQAEKDELMRTSGSPILAETRSQFLPLAYFPPSIQYRVPAILRVEQERQPFEVPTSTGLRRKMLRVGTLQFAVKGASLSLGSFVEADARTFDRLFVPFTDLTSGTETYPAGRYLDLERTRTGIYIIDFNRAYNPYCYYNPTYDCPFPPRSNRLEVPIRAGERMKDSAIPVMGNPGKPAS